MNMRCRKPVTIIFLKGVLSVFAVALIAGCEPNQGKSKAEPAAKSTASPAAAPATPATPAVTPAPASPMQPPAQPAAKPPEPAPPPAAPAQPTAATTPPKAAEKPAATKSEWEEQKPLAIEDDSGRRAMAENMIYATIRIKMEEMIDQRAGLLKSGKAPSDVEVRSLEGSIMRARDLLMEAGEIVEDVQPPIVEVRPAQGQ